MCVWVSGLGRAGGELLACNHSPVRFVIIERSQLSEECSQQDTPVKTSTRDTGQYTYQPGNNFRHYVKTSAEDNKMIFEGEE